MQLKVMLHFIIKSFSKSSTNFYCSNNLKFKRLSCPVYFGNNERDT